MRCRTHFWGSITVDPPLNEHETTYLKEKVAGDWDAHPRGPYRTRPAESAVTANAIHRGRSATDAPALPAQNVPALYCDWVLADDGTTLGIAERETYNDPAGWARYLIDTFLRPGAVLQHDLAHRLAGWDYPPELDYFSFDHVCNGEVDAQGQQRDDRWRIAVRDNQLSIQDGYMIFARETLIASAGAIAERESEPGHAEPAPGMRPVAQLVVVRADGDAVAWTSSSPSTFDGIFRGAGRNQTLDEVLDNPGLRVPPGTPIVRLDLTPPFPAQLFGLHGPDPSPTLPIGSVRRIYRDAEPYIGEPEQLLKMAETSVDLYYAFAAQCGVVTQHTAPDPRHSPGSPKTGPAISTPPA
ncbi:MAG TPA: hypothetical protein VGL46_17685 [Pseudonocardiaceae bacterium]